MKNKLTAKNQSTIRVDSDFKKKDKRAWLFVKHSLKTTGNDIRNMRTKLSKLSIIQSSDLKDLDIIIDKYDDFNKKIQGIVKDRLSPEKW